MSGIQNTRVRLGLADDRLGDCEEEMTQWDFKTIVLEQSPTETFWERSRAAVEHQQALGWRAIGMISSVDSAMVYILFEQTGNGIGYYENLAYARQQ